MGEPWTTPKPFSTSTRRPAAVSAFDFLDITQLEVSEVVYLSLAIALGITLVSLGIAWLWKRYKG